MKRRALVVGIDHYEDLPALTACGRDATAMAAILSQHQDGRPNFDCVFAVDALESGEPLTRAALREALQQLFATQHHVLFYFSGHGAPARSGGLLCTVDGRPNDWGIAMSEVVDLANQSSCLDALIILDCCHAGDMG